MRRGRPRHREALHQEAIVRYARERARLEPDPWAWLFATQNGVRTSALQAILAKRAGMVSGIPDLIWPVRRGGYAGAWLEVKAPAVYAEGRQVDRPGTVDPAQRAWLQHLTRHGYYAAAVWGEAAGIAALEWYAHGTAPQGPPYREDESAACGFAIWRPDRPTARGGRDGHEDRTATAADHAGGTQRGAPRSGGAHVGGVASPGE